MATNETTNIPTYGSTSVSLYETDDNITAVSPIIADWISHSRLPRSLYKGTMGMQDAGQEFLPKHPLESDYGYNSRLTRSTLLNAFRKTTSFLAGQVFQSDVIFDDGVPEVFKDLASSIDVKENALDVFAKRVFQNGLAKGVGIIMVDGPAVAEGVVMTKADENEMGVRPYFKEVNPESILGFIVDEDGALVQVRILETKTERVGRFGSKQVEQIRVLEPGSWELWEMADGKSATMTDSGTFGVQAIPLAIFIPGEDTTILTGETPLMDLADLNKKHWMSSSDQDNIMHVARVPILMGTNIDIPNMPVGVSAMVTSTDENADLKYVEVVGKAIESGFEHLRQTEAQMALYGLQQLVPRTGNMTATEKAITSAESNSSLGTWATEYESVLQSAFEMLGVFIGEEFPPNSVNLNKEYNFGVADPQELTSILAAQAQGVTSKQGAFTEFRRRGVFDEHTTWDDVEADNEQDARDDTTMAGLAGTVFGTTPEPEGEVV